MSTLIPIGGVRSEGFDGPGCGPASGARGSGGGRSVGWIATGLLWCGRGIAAVLAIFWGLFFVEHLSWFSDPNEWPPPWVTAAMVAHATIILGLAAMLRWSRLGIVLTLVGTIGFIAPTVIGGKPAWIMLINLVPIALVALGTLLAARRSR